jgi:hypothetical protein
VLKLRRKEFLTIWKSIEGWSDYNVTYVRMTFVNCDNRHAHFPTFFDPLCTWQNTEKIINCCRTLWTTFFVCNFFCTFSPATLRKPRPVFRSVEEFGWPPSQQCFLGKFAPVFNVARRAETFNGTLFTRFPSSANFNLASTVFSVSKVILTSPVFTVKLFMQLPFKFFPCVVRELTYQKYIFVSPHFYSFRN